MKKVLLLLIPFVIIGCCNESKKLKNGLTKKASEITEYIISSNNDTILVSTKKYNSYDLIINQKRKTLHDNETIEIEYEYNEFKKIKKEIVNMYVDSSILFVDYFYKDSLLIESKSITINDTERFEQFQTYNYYDNNIRKNAALKMLYIDLKTNDTISNILSKSFFNKKGILFKTIDTNFQNQSRSNKTIFKYNCNNLKSQEVFNLKDSLLYKITYKYTLDEFKNWIIKKSFKNDKISSKTIRRIKYK